MSTKHDKLKRIDDIYDMSKYRIDTINSSSLKDREHHIDKLMEEMKSRMQDIQGMIDLNNNVEVYDEESLGEEAVARELEKINEEKSNLEKELACVENRIRHMIQENDDIEKDIVAYDSKTKKILEVRKKKIEWEKEQRDRIKRLQADLYEKRISLAERAKARDERINSIKQQHENNLSSVHNTIKEDKQTCNSVKSKMAEYNKMMVEFKKMVQSYDQSVHKENSGAVDRHKKIEKKTELVFKVKEQQSYVSDIKSRLDKIRVLEDKMIEDKKISINNKEMLKSRFQDVLNKKLDEHEINEMLTSNAVNHPNSSRALGRHNSISSLLGEGDNVPIKSGRDSGVKRTPIKDNKRFAATHSNTNSHNRSYSNKKIEVSAAKTPRTNMETPKRTTIANRTISKKIEPSPSPKTPGGFGKEPSSNKSGVSSSRKLNSSPSPNNKGMTSSKKTIDGSGKKIETQKPAEKKADGILSQRKIIGTPKNDDDSKKKGEVSNPKKATETPKRSTETNSKKTEEANKKTEITGEKASPLKKAETIKKPIQKVETVKNIVVPQTKVQKKNEPVTNTIPSKKPGTAVQKTPPKQLTPKKSITPTKSPTPAERKEPEKIDTPQSHNKPEPETLPNPPPNLQQEQLPRPPLPQAPEDHQPVTTNPKPQTPAPEPLPPAPEVTYQQPTVDETSPSPSIPNTASKQVPSIGGSLSDPTPAPVLTPPAPYDPPSSSNNIDSVECNNHTLDVLQIDPTTLVGGGAGQGLVEETDELILEDVEDELILDDDPVPDPDHAEAEDGEDKMRPRIQTQPLIPEDDEEILL